jgi:hypothetical protein
MCRQCLSKYFANTKGNIIERKLSRNNVYIRYDNLYEVFSQKNSHTWIATNDCLSVLIKIYILHIRICEKNRYLTCALHAALRKISTYFSQRNPFLSFLSARLTWNWQGVCRNFVFWHLFTYDAWFRLYYEVYTRVTVLQVLHYLYLGLGSVCVTLCNTVGLGLVCVTLCNTVGLVCVTLCNAVNTLQHYVALCNTM